MNPAHLEAIRQRFIALLAEHGAGSSNDERERVAAIAGSLARYAYDLASEDRPAIPLDPGHMPEGDKSALAIAFVRACDRHNYDSEHEGFQEFGAETMGVAYLLGRIRERVGAEESEPEMPPINSLGGAA